MTHSLLSSARARRVRFTPDNGIRRLRAGEGEQLMRAGHLFDGPLDRRAVNRYLREPANHVWLAYRAGRPVGFLRGTELLQVEHRRKQFFLYEVAVDPAYRRTGVGRSLVRAMLAHARRRGLAEAFVFTSPNNRAAVRLYTSTGGVTETDADRMFVYANLHRPSRRRAARC
jgi:[ribosomal protein S18]-alanine N-acetyltransferase